MCRARRSAYPSRDSRPPRRHCGSAAWRIELPQPFEPSPGGTVRLTRLSLVLLANLVPAVLAAQTGVVYGRVTDSTGAAVPRATITVDGSYSRSSSGDRGDYE